MKTELNVQSILRSVCLAAVCALSFFVSACATTPDVAETPDLILKNERAIGEDMLKAFQEDDADKFMSFIPEGDRERFTEKNFDATRKAITESLGEVKSYEYVTVLNAPGFRTHLWKVRFERTKVMDRDAKLTQETLFRVVTVTPDKKNVPYVVTFGFL